MKIVHWLKFEQATSGLYTYTYSLHRATLALGYESHICYSDYDLRDGGKMRFPNPTIGTVEYSPWEVSEGAINITHDAPPHMKLDNYVTEMHGHPHFAAQDMDALSTTGYQLARAELILTRFPSHVQYWKEYTDRPIHVIPPGVDLNFWTREGKRTPLIRPVVLWADTVREGVKNPINLLYAMKIVNRELPVWGLRLVAIPPDELAGFAYLCGRLGLDSIVDWPIEPMIRNMDELYRGVAHVGGLLYSDTNIEGSNVSWEAEACGLPVIHHQDTPQKIAYEILYALESGVRKTVVRDIKDTAKAMIDVFTSYFK